jgi:hypothetical protein
MSMEVFWNLATKVWHLVWNLERKAGKNIPNDTYLPFRILLTLCTYVRSTFPTCSIFCKLLLVNGNIFSLQASTLRLLWSQRSKAVENWPNTASCADWRRRGVGRRVRPAMTSSTACPAKQLLSCKLLAIPAAAAADKHRYERSYERKAGAGTPCTVKYARLPGCSSAQYLRIWDSNDPCQKAIWHQNI